MCQKNIYLYGILVFVLLGFSVDIFAENKMFNSSYFYGREYFLLRSGRAKMIIQCDKVDFGPAFTYLLFDAESPAQTLKKSNAYNYDSLNNSIYSSALTVKINGYPFTAMGQTTDTDWTTVDGIPSFEAGWWASGLKITEVVTPLSDVRGIFKRQITVEAKNLIGPDTVSLCFNFPMGNRKLMDGMITCQKENALMTYVFPNCTISNREIALRDIDVVTFVLKTGEKRVLDSYLFVDIPKIPIENLVEKIDTILRKPHEEKKKLIEKWNTMNSIKTKDELVMNSFNVNRNILPAYVSDKGKMDAALFEYGSQWVRDGSHTTLGLIHMGDFGTARATLEHMLCNMINERGTTMIANGYDEPDREQFDQMGEFIHALKSYVNWTGDTSLLRCYQNKLIAMIDRPLSDKFRDETGMVHNRREYWERTFEDAYELAYQVWVVQGLLDAVDLSTYFRGDKDSLFWIEKSKYWKKEAVRIKTAMLTHPQMKLIQNGHFIKRRSVDGYVVDTVKMDGWVEGAPASVEVLSKLMPDATLSLPISLEMIDPESELSINTLELLEELWNLRWNFGGYERYHSSSQGDQPGPWGFATSFILRAQHEAKLFERSRRGLDWIYWKCGGRTGAIYEEIPLLKTQYGGCGLLPWNSAEIIYFVIHHMLGIKFLGNRIFFQPQFYKETSDFSAKIRYKQSWITIQKKGEGRLVYAIVNGVKIKPDVKGRIFVPNNFDGGLVELFYF